MTTQQRHWPASSESLLGTQVSCSFEPRREKTYILVSDRFDTNQAVQLQKMATDLKFRI